MPTIHVIDDDAGVRRMLGRVLRAEGFEVQAHDCAEAFLAQAEPAPAGCLLLDVSLPGLDGLALQQRLRALGHELPIVFLSGQGDIPMTVRAIKCGAADFLTKPVASETLLAAVRSALAQGETQRHADTEAAALHERYQQLSERERDVLDALIAGRLNKQIAAELGIVERTVKYHRARIMQRMQARTLSELMHQAARLGLGTTPALAGA